jgi:hypothetical protein
VAGFSHALGAPLPTMRARNPRGRKMDSDQKLAALADRCGAPDFGPEGVCAACCFARKVTTRIAATERDVQTTLALCTYRQKVVAPLLDLDQMSNPGIPHPTPAMINERQHVKSAFAEAPPEERQAFATLIDTLYEQHLKSPPPSP